MALLYGLFQAGYIQLLCLFYGDIPPAVVVKEFTVVDVVKVLSQE